jgi:hypothetical protein
MSEELFRDFWWLIFPIFGMVMALLGAVEDGRRADAVIGRARRWLEGKQ